MATVNSEGIAESQYESGTPKREVKKPIRSKRSLEKLMRDTGNPKGLRDVAKNFDALNNVVNTYDRNLKHVLGKHEEEFLTIYKGHVLKVEKELSQVKKTAADQEMRMRRNDDIKTLETYLKIFEDESDKLRVSSNHQKKAIEKWKSKAESISEDQKFLHSQLKATKRENKILKAALAKTQAEVEKLEDYQLQVEASKLEKPKPHYIDPEEFSEPSMLPLAYGGDEDTGITQITNRTLELLQATKNKQQHSQSVVGKSRAAAMAAAIVNKSMIDTRRQGSFTGDQFTPSGQKSSGVKSSHFEKLKSLEKPPTDVKLREFLGQLFNSNLSTAEREHEIQKYYFLRAERYRETQSILDRQLTKQKNIVKHHLEQKTDSVTMKNDLENFFLECIEEARKDIVRRRCKTNVRRVDRTQQRSKTNKSVAVSRKSSVLETPLKGSNDIRPRSGGRGMRSSSVGIQQEGSTTTNAPVRGLGSDKTPDLEEFAASDKRKVVELLLSNQQVLVLLYEKLFPQKNLVNLLQNENSTTGPGMGVGGNHSISQQQQSSTNRSHLAGSQNSIGASFYRQSSGGGGGGNQGQDNVVVRKMVGIEYDDHLEEKLSLLELQDALNDTDDPSKDKPKYVAPTVASRMPKLSNYQTDMVTSVDQGSFNQRSKNAAIRAKRF